MVNDPIFPCRSNKSPATRRGFYDAKPRGEWGQLEPELWGRPTGDGFFVVDVDSSDGLDALREAIGVELPETLTSKTPRGFHAYYRMPAGVEIRNRQGVVPGVDVRGRGGYVICWPFVDAGVPIAEAPGALVELCRPRVETTLL
jgi:hypothetical protein